MFQTGKISSRWPQISVQWTVFVCFHKPYLKHSDLILWQWSVFWCQQATYFNNISFLSVWPPHNWTTLYHPPHNQHELHWILLDFTINWVIITILTNLASSRLHWTGMNFTISGLDWNRLSTISMRKLDSTGLHWTARCIWHKTGLHWTANYIQQKLDFTGLYWTTNHIHQKIGLYWTVNHIWYKSGLCWTPLTVHCTQHKTRLARYIGTGCQ